MVSFRQHVNRAVCEVVRSFSILRKVSLPVINEVSEMVISVHKELKLNIDFNLRSSVGCEDSEKGEEEKDTNNSDLVSDAARVMISKKFLH